MNYLLDTHILLWWLEDNSALSGRAKELIRNKQNLIYVSVVSIWEIRIKQALNRLELYEDFDKDLISQPFQILDIKLEHANGIAVLPEIHKDPFDRMLISQAKIENAVLISSDAVIQRYDVDVLAV